MNQDNISQPQLRAAIGRSDLEQLLSSAGNDKVAKDLSFVANIIFHTGLRPGELSHLVWSSVDLQNRFLRVGSKSREPRKVPFGPQVLYLLLERAEPAARSGFLLGKAPSLTLGNVIRRLNRIGHSSLAPKVTLRQIRLSFAHRWVACGGSVTALALVMGFSATSVLKRLVPMCTAYESAARFQSVLERLP